MSSRKLVEESADARRSGFRLGNPRRTDDAHNEPSTEDAWPRVHLLEDKQFREHLFT